MPRRRRMRAADKRLERHATDVLESPRLRVFPYLGDWAVVTFPLDRFESRPLAWAYLRALYEFHDNELVELPARQLRDENDVERIWWVVAIRPAGVRRRRKT